MKREEQAKATRAAIVHAAYRLFVADGYAVTTIQAIADEAGVAVQTVYAGFGNKRRVLDEVIEAAIVGDDPTPVADRPEITALATEPDPRRSRRDLGGVCPPDHRTDLPDRARRSGRRQPRTRSTRRCSRR